MAEYALPDLPYDYGALEPHISGKVMELHHDKHHAAYVKNANSALEQLAGWREADDFAKLGALEKALAFNLSGHILHSIFWQNLTPKGGERPEGELARVIERDLGGFDRFKRQMTAVAATVMGSGWAALVWEPIGQRLVTTQIYDHQSNLAQGGLPIMVIDAWEHAYYLQYQNRKTEFFDAIWSVWNWRDIGERFSAVSKTNVVLPRAFRR
jgi:Fe-Mn family superoxide dismutase